MIKITLNESKRKKIENFYWDYIEKNLLINWEKKINKSITRKAIFKNRDEIKKIVLSSPENLETIVASLGEKKLKRLKYFKNQYEIIRSKIGYDILKILDLKTCPYCNRSYIYTAKKNSKPRFQLDHFFSKTNYPYLAVSLYNLIPCCGTCNMIKNDSDSEKLLNPYLSGFEKEGIFKIDNSIKNITNLLNHIDDLKIKIDVVGSKTEKIINNIDEFDLENIYNTHSNEVLRLVKLKMIYSDSQLNEYIELYGEHLNLNFEEMKALIFGIPENTEREQEKVLGKFLNDILNDIENDFL